MYFFVISNNDGRIDSSSFLFQTLPTLTPRSLHRPIFSFGGFSHRSSEVQISKFSEIGQTDQCQV